MTSDSQALPTRWRSHGGHGGVAWPVARSVAAAAADPLDAIDLPLAAAGGAVLAVPLGARAPLPSYNTAAMDGYAVAGRGPWLVTGRVLAGHTMFRAILAGHAVEIATGAPVPDGSDAVLPYERAVRVGSTVDGVLEPGRHIRWRGEECREGTEVLPAGTLVTPVVQGLAASLGHDVLRVRRRPRVAILVTGDEVATSGRPGRGRVRDAVGPVLPGLVSWAGGRPEAVAAVEDRRAAVADAIGAAAADVVVVCGACSRGPADHVRGVLQEAEAEFLVEGVACRPGHPQLLARLGDGRLVVGLPGNPFAALVAALTLLVPVLTVMSGRTRPVGERAPLLGELAAHAVDTRLVAVRRTAGGAVPAGHDRPGLLWGAALADALAVVPPGWRGGEVELIQLPT
ncbi:molybdopterin-binding protein [Actinomadura alba]|uniref:Molybdopterin molybdenumtransferase n=1 Tax=Actinomadura alba TaxID=406431 RepID=A0ABR7LSX6_9ACTN|nr:molybdopterin-binding protein [Actinomadura alba]MBC6467846.1 molybdopterin molybdenumtransferase MoeA [Actinomadura alba]